MKTLVINSSNYVAGSGNTFVYKFPTATSFAKGDRVALANVAMTNSTYNISAARGNNTVTILWASLLKNDIEKIPSGTAVTINGVTWRAEYQNYNFYFPDGFYTITQLNTYLQLQMFNMGMFMTKDNGANIIYFFNIVAIPSQYSVQIQAYALPNIGDQATWALPVLGDMVPINAIPGLTGALAGTTYPRAGASKNWWCSDGLIPANFNINATPQLTLPSSFSSLLGFTATSFAWNNRVRATYASSATNFNSTTAPQIAPVNSYIMTCSLLNNPYAVPINVFYTIPLSVGIGSLMSIYPSQLIWNDIAPNNYNQITIQFFDQVFNSITLQDPNIVVMLVILGEGEEG